MLGCRYACASQLPELPSTATCLHETLSTSPTQHLRSLHIAPCASGCSVWQRQLQNNSAPYPDGTFDLTQLLPDDLSYYTYEGSLVRACSINSMLPVECALLHSQYLGAASCAAPCTPGPGSLEHVIAFEVHMHACWHLIDRSVCECAAQMVF